MSSVRLKGPAAVVRAGNSRGTEQADSGTAGRRRRKARAATASDGEQDPLYDQAVRIVVESRKASISGVQRRLKIGYNRAARMIETMEAAGLVGPLQSNGSREVLAPPPAEE